MDGDPRLSGKKRKAQSFLPADQSKFFIGGLYHIGEQQVSDYFSQFGEVVSCQLMKNRQTGQSRGFAFVTLHDPEGIIKEQILNQKHEIEGNFIDVKMAEDDQKR